MTYNVFSGTLNPTQSINQSSYIAYVENDKKYEHSYGRTMES